MNTSSNSIVIVEMNGFIAHVLHMCGFVYIYMFEAKILINFFLIVKNSYWYYFIWKHFLKYISKFKINYIICIIKYYNKF